MFVLESIHSKVSRGMHSSPKPSLHRRSDVDSNAWRSDTDGHLAPCQIDTESSDVNEDLGVDHTVQVYGVGYSKEPLWGAPKIAEMKAVFETTLSSDNESLLRTYHPALAKEKYVQIINEGGRKSWRIFKTSSCKTPTLIAGADVHIVPPHNSPDLAGGAWFDRAYRPDPIPRDINPRRCLRPADLTIVRKTFPCAIGLRILIFRFALVVYSNAEEMHKDWDAGVPATLGGLSLGYISEDSEPSTGVFPSGMSTSTTANRYTDVAALGLRLRMADGRECVTTVTHAFVQHKPKSRTRLFFSHWVQMAKRSLARFQVPRAPPSQPAQILATVARPHSVIGKKGWAAGTNNLIGTVETTYDKPREDSIFPAGYYHDLSLIYGDSLPKICPPPNVAMAAEWGHYKDALDGAPVFVTAFNSRWERWDHLEGKVASKAVEHAVIQGTAYSWDGITRASSAGLLWRTKEDSLSAQGWSGSVLCLGRPGRQKAEPLLFQNYQSIFHCWPVGEAPESETPTDSVKGGGFFLPTEIREASIILSDSEGSRRILSGEPVNSAHPTRLSERIQQPIGSIENGRSLRVCYLHEARSVYGGNINMKGMKIGIAEQEFEHLDLLTHFYAFLILLIPLLTSQ